MSFFLEAEELVPDSHLVCCRLARIIKVAIFIFGSETLHIIVFYEFVQGTTPLEGSSRIGDTASLRPLVAGLHVLPKKQCGFRTLLPFTLLGLSFIPFLFAKVP